MNTPFRFLNSARAAAMALLGASAKRAPNRPVLAVSLVVALLFAMSITAVLAVQESSGGLQALGIRDPSSADDQSGVKYVGELKPVDAPAVKEQPVMIDIVLASVEIGPQAERCGSEQVAKEKLKAVVRQYVAVNRSNIRTQQVGEGDSLTVMACVYPNDFYPSQAVLSVAVPLRPSQPIFIPVSEDCVKRVNEAMAQGQLIPLDCKPSIAPLEPETLLIPVSLAEVAQ